MRARSLSLRSSTVACGLLGWGLLAGMMRPAFAADGEPVLERVEYKGWKDNIRLSNGEVELIITLDVGPRIISYRLKGGKNVFKEYEEQLGKTGESGWMIRGGHRLWVSPEDPERTYYPDNGPVRVEQVSPGFVRLTPAPETKLGLQKEIDLILAPSGSRVTVLHKVRNISPKPTELAIWSLSVMAPGGVEIIPLSPHKAHPGGPENVKSADDYAPDQLFRLWSYTDFSDPRWHFGSRYITLRQDADREATKLGLAHKMGWVGYLNGGSLFVKRIAYQADKQPYPDGGCSYETFTNRDMLEMESLSPLVKLAPGKETRHAEHWELIPDVKPISDEASIDRIIAPIVGEE